MKIVVKAEKSGQVVAQSEFKITTEDLRKTLFDDEVRIKFEKTE
jgi:hypothetical protein